MIRYHGLPINPQTAAVQAVDSGHAFVSWADTHPLGLAVMCCQSFAIDNGAYPAWKAKKPIKDWTPFYQWALECKRIPNCDFAVIPDVIDGTEDENDRLVRAWPLGESFGAPVWHMHESMNRLRWLVREFPRVCLGSSGKFAQVGTAEWWGRMAAAMKVVCDEEGRPKTRLHGLRMLNPEIFRHLPLSSADSTNIARNIGIDKAWKGTYQPPTKEARATVMRARIESVRAPSRWDFDTVSSLNPEAQGALL